MTQTAATALTFVVLMAMHPDKQRKAQAEIDSVTEGLRLPTLADRARMPYVVAIMNEVARWHAVVPLGMLFLQIVFQALLDDLFDRIGPSD